MEKSGLVELITHWESFRDKNPGGSVSSFCSHYLYTNKKGAGKKPNLFKGMSPPDSLTTLSKLIRRVADIHAAYSKMALAEIDGFDPEWFWYLNAVAHQGEARKTDIINFNFHEQSTGTDIIRRLLKAGYISERDDENDKRARLIALTEKGVKINARVCKLMYLPCLILFDDLGEEEKQLIITLLSGVEIKHTEKFPDHKQRNIIDLSKEVWGTKRIDELLASVGLKKKK